MTAIERIAAWSARLRYEDVPEAVRRAAIACLADTLGVAIAGLSRPPARAARRHASTAAAAGEATVLGETWRLHPAGAAFANAAAAHALDFDDNCNAGSVHGSAVVVPAALAVAEAEGRSGAALLAALVAGAEAEYAFGEALTPALYEKGFWTTGMLGVIGAAVAAAHARSLDARATAQAVGLAVAGTGGLKACFGTDAKPLLCGRSAESGVVAAALAAEGATGPLDAFEHARGFAHLFNDGVFDDAAIGSIGERWRVLTPGIDVKRIPVCLSSHAAVDGVRALIAEHRIAAADVARVVCDVTPLVTTNLAHAWPETVQQAQFSLPFAVACTLQFGDVGLAQLDPCVVADPRVQALMQRVEMQSTQRWRTPALQGFPEGAHIAVVLRDGRRFERLSTVARGTAAQPLAATELQEKFMACAGAVIGAAPAEALLERLQDVAALPCARALLEPIDWSGAAPRLRA